jgi:hypothetical protein
MIWSDHHPKPDPTAAEARQALRTMRRVWPLLIAAAALTLLVTLI